MSDLSTGSCEPCRSGAPLLTGPEIEKYRLQVPDWHIVEVDGVAHLTRSFGFKTFKQALVFTNRVAEIAEAQRHHPALLTEWGRVTVSWWTHKIGGLHQNDFIMAAKTDRLFDEG